MTLARTKSSSRFSSNSWAFQPRSPAGRIRERVGEGLRLLALQHVERALVLPEPLQDRHGRLLVLHRRSASSAGFPLGKAEQLRDVYPGHLLGLLAAELGRDHRAGVVADRAVALVTEASHQLGPGRGDPSCSPPGLQGRAGEAVAGKRREHDVERVSRVGSVRGRVNEPADEVDVLEDRSGPPVAEHDGERARHGRAGVQEVHRLPVDLGEELRVGVEPVLPAAPVELLPPGDQAPDPAERDAVGAVFGPRGLLGRPPRRRQAGAAGRPGRRRGSWR